MARHSLELRFGYFPSADKIRLLILRAPDGFTRWEAGLSRPPSEESLREWNGKLPFQKAGITLDALALSDGTYALGVALIAKDGARREIRRTFERTHYAWENNPAGRDRVIIPPFTPLQVDKAGRTVSCVLRRHELAGTGLWMQVYSQQRPLLAAPMRLEIETDGKTHIAEGDNLSFSEKSADRVRGQADWAAGPVQGRAEFDFDYDGMAKIALHLAPDDAQVDRMRLVIPMRTDETSLMHPVTDLLRFHYAGRIPDGRGRLWEYGGELKEVRYTETGPVRPRREGVGFAPRRPLAAASSLCALHLAGRSGARPVLVCRERSPSVLGGQKYCPCVQRCALPPVHRRSLAATHTAAACWLTSRPC